MVVPEHLRGRGLGRRIMELAESHAKMQGYTTMYLSTKDKQDLYAHLGYEFCQAVNTLDAQVRPEYRDGGRAVQHAELIEGMAKVYVCPPKKKSRPLF